MTKQSKTEHPIKSIINNLIVIGGVLTALIFAYQIGKRSEAMNHRMEIMEIQQKYNTEITNLKLDYNQKVIESNSKLAVEVARLNEEIQKLKNKLSDGK